MTSAEFELEGARFVAEANIEALPVLDGPDGDYVEVPPSPVRPKLNANAAPFFGGGPGAAQPPCIRRYAAF